MLLVGDKIECKLEMGGVIKVGEVCEVTNFNNNCIEFKFRELHKGVMSYDEFEKYFVKQENKGWSKWIYRTVPLNDKGFEYRTNGKTVQVRIKGKYGVYKGSCTCYKTDAFDLNKGIKLSYIRANIDGVKKMEKYLLKEM